MDQSELDPGGPRTKINAPPSLILWLSAHSVSDSVDFFSSALHPSMGFMATKDGSSRQPESLGKVLMLTCSPIAPVI